MEKAELVRTVNAMIAAPSCCAELQEAGKNYLAAVGTPQEAAALAALAAEIREDVCTLDHTIPFFESELGTRIFGAEKARELAAHARERKAQGEKWCDCPACSAGVKILESLA